MSSSREPESGTLGDLFVLSAPSGTGKTSLIKLAFSRAWAVGTPPEFSVSHTTRSPRPDEIDGKNYHFVDTGEFERMIEADEFLEWAEVHGQLKGTAQEEVDKRVTTGVDVLLDIDIQGVERVLDLYPEACSILVLPPSYRELRRRLVGRGHDSADDVARRLSVSLWEIERYTMFDYVIVNDEIERASHELTSIITSRRRRTERNKDRIEAILGDFRGALENHPQDNSRRNSQSETTDGPNTGQD